MNPMLLNESMLKNAPMLGAIQPIQASMLGAPLSLPPVGSNYDEIRNMSTGGINPSAPPVMQPVAQPVAQPMTGVEKFQNIINALQPLSEMIDDNNARSVLPAEKYLQYKKEKEDQKQSRQNQLLDSLKLDADIKYRQEQLEIQREQNAIAREALVRGDARTSSGSSYMQDAMLLMQSNPSLNIMDAYMMSRSGLPRGVTIDPATGQASALPNFAETVAGIEGTVTGQKEASKIKAADLANAQINLGSSNEQSRQILDLINQIETHKGLSSVVGAPNPLGGRIPFVGNVVGSPAADFQAKLDQLGGKQFLQAFESLKGGGQITQIEGEKATNAIASMQTAQSEEQFLSSLKEFKDIVIRAQERAAQKAGVPSVDFDDAKMKRLQELRAKKAAGEF